MKRTVIVSGLALLLGGLSSALGAASDQASPETRRLALVVGANHGTPDRVPLRYAVADAERFAQVILRMGGVKVEDCFVLREPTRQSLLEALALIRNRAQALRGTGTRTEVLLYFSGHADEKGLMLGRELLPYRELRQAMGQMTADIGITVLDACASGAITRLKGGQAHPAFLTDASMQVKGYAFLTSSSENEAAQESERLRGSYFTHALLTGMRGAADLSGDGQVTLGEAYQFAFGETLQQTTATQAGAQHPTWDIKMAGTGDVVLTDVRQTSASMIFPSELDGRFFVRNARGHLVAELYKPYGRKVELGVEPGAYEVHFEQERALFATKVTIADGQHRALERRELAATTRQPTRRRGPGDDVLVPLRHLGRTQIEMRFGYSDASTHVDTTAQSTTVEGGEFALSAVHFLREDWAIEFSFGGSDLGVETRTGLLGEESRTRGLFGVMLGGRYYPPLSGSIRPYARAVIGPLSELDVASTPTTTDVTEKGAKLGAQIGGGVDFMIGRRFSLSGSAAVTLRPGSRGAFGVCMGFGWSFRGRRRPSGPPLLDEPSVAPVAVAEPSSEAPPPTE
jgi:hypothetical protein